MHLKRTKPTNYEAAKLVIIVGEEFTAADIIDRMLNNGRKEMLTTRQLSAKMCKDSDFIVVRSSSGRKPTIFKRVM